MTTWAQLEAHARGRYLVTQSVADDLMFIRWHEPRAADGSGVETAMIFTAAFGPRRSIIIRFPLPNIDQVDPVALMNRVEAMGAVATVDTLVGKLFLRHILPLDDLDPAEFDLVVESLRDGARQLEAYLRGLPGFGVIEGAPSVTAFRSWQELEAHAGRFHAVIRRDESEVWLRLADGALAFVQEGFLGDRNYVTLRVEVADLDERTGALPLLQRVERAGGVVTADAIAGSLFIRHIVPLRVLTPPEFSDLLDGLRVIAAELRNEFAAGAFAAPSPEPRLPTPASDHAVSPSPSQQPDGEFHLATAFYRPERHRR